jgi:ATP/maltotriose-dependent transcriptional regulator MalT
MMLALLGLGRLLSSEGKQDEGINLMLEADRIAQKQGDSVVAHLSKLYLCTAYFNKGDYARALEEGAKGVEVGRKTGLTNTTDFHYLLAHMGLSLTRTQRAKEGEPLLRESLDWFSVNAPQNLSDIAQGKGALGECLTSQARYSEAEPLLLESYETLKNQAGQARPYLKQAQQRLVTLYENWKKLDKAAAYRAGL